MTDEVNEQLPGYEYDVVCVKFKDMATLDTMKQLATAVTQKGKTGWYPQGNPFEHAHWLCQAIVRKI